MTIERFENNWQPQMDSYARFNFNLDLKELVQQIRADALDEFRKRINGYLVESEDFADFVVTDGAIDCVIDEMKCEQLKEGAENG